MNHIRALGEAYSDVFSQIFVDTERSPFHPVINRELSSDICQIGFKYLNSKLSCTVRTLGSEALVNAFIESAGRDLNRETTASSVSSENSTHTAFIADLGLKSALKFHILLTENKLSKRSIDVRRLVRVLVVYASSSSLQVMESIWRNVIIESVLQSCTPLQQSKFQCFTPNSPSTQNYIGTPGGGKSSNNTMVYSTLAVPGSPLSSSAMVPVVILPQIKPATEQTPEMSASAAVDTLLQDLCKAREASRVDLKCLNCTMSADLAFATAYLRLPKECSVEIAKALAVRISSLLDYQKLRQQQQQQQNRYSNDFDRFHKSSNVCTSTDIITDLICVLFGQTSSEFQHFYEILLARRLLRNRFISLEREKEIINALPALDKSILMIRYVS